MGFLSNLPFVGNDMCFYGYKHVCIWIPMFTEHFVCTPWWSSLMPPFQMRSSNWNQSENYNFSQRNFFESERGNREWDFLQHGIFRIPIKKRPDFDISKKKFYPIFATRNRLRNRPSKTTLTVLVPYRYRTGKNQEDLMYCVST